MYSIIFNKEKHSYNRENREFLISEKDVPFDTSYEIINPKTNKGEQFVFSHSTGPEFAPDTKWIYKDKSNTITLAVCNDPEMVKIAAANYLAAKMRQ